MKQVLTPAKFIPATDRKGRLNRSETVALRNYDWLQDFEVGRLDPISRRIRRRTIAQIAQTYGVTEQTVRNGIAAARQNQDLVRDGLATCS